MSPATSSVELTRRLFPERPSYQLECAHRGEGECPVCAAMRRPWDAILGGRILDLDGEG